MRTYRSSRKGMSLIEVSIVLIVAAIVMGGIFMISSKMMTGSRAESTLQSFRGLVSAIEKASVNNLGVYPASAAGAISANSILTTELGGANAIRDLSGWTYACAAGTNSTITIVTAAFEDAGVRNSMLMRINGSYAPWVAAVNGATALTITRTGVKCQ